MHNQPVLAVVDCKRTPSQKWNEHARNVALGLAKRVRIAAVCVRLGGAIRTHPHGTVASVERLDDLFPKHVCVAILEHQYFGVSLEEQIMIKKCISLINS